MNPVRVFAFGEKKMGIACFYILFACNKMLINLRDGIMPWGYYLQRILYTLVNSGHVLCVCSLISQRQKVSESVRNPIP